MLPRPDVVIVGRDVPPVIVVEYTAKLPVPLASRLPALLSVMFCRPSVPAVASMVPLFCSTL